MTDTQTTTYQTSRSPEAVAAIEATPALESGSAVRPATAMETDQTIDTLVLAFAEDPAVRWVFPEADAYLRWFGPFIRAFGGAAFESGGALVDAGHRGAALWLPPGVEPDGEALVALLERSLPADRLRTMHEVLALMDHYHPHEPHWYLPLIGVEPAHRGGGIGSALLAAALERCDRDGRPAYLEATSPRNARLYLQCGFEVIGTIQAGDFPAMWAMVRPAR